MDTVMDLGINVIHMTAEGNQPSMMIKKEHQSSQSVDENGNVQLHWVCYADDEESVNLSLNSDKNINAKDKEKLTSLYLAILGGREKISIKIIKKNTNKNIKNIRGELPIDLTKNKN